MNCKHSPASYMKILTQGDEGMTCRHCNKPIRAKSSSNINVVRRILVVLPIIIFCVIAGMDFPNTPAGKMAIVGCFFGCLAITLIGWLIVCKFVLKYEEIPEAPKAEDSSEKE